MVPNTRGMNAVSSPNPAEILRYFRNESMQARQEDQVEHTDAADRVERVEVRQHIEHVRSDQRTTQQQPEKTGQPESLGDQRPEHDDQSDNRHPERRPLLYFFPRHGSRS